MNVYSQNFLDLCEDLLSICPEPTFEEWLDEEWENIDRSQKDGIYRIKDE